MQISSTLHIIIKGVKHKSVYQPDCFHCRKEVDHLQMFFLGVGAVAMLSFRDVPVVLVGHQVTISLYSVASCLTKTGV